MQRRRDISRELILEAAEARFLQKGFSATSIQEIAAAAGYTTGAIYSSFTGKDELFLAVFRRRVAMQRKIWEDAFESVTTPADAAAAMGTALSLLLPDTAWYAVTYEFLSYAARRDQLNLELAEAFHHAQTTFEAILDGVAESSPLPRERLVPVVHALGRGFAFTWFVDPDAADPSLFSDAVAVLMGVSPAGSAGSH